MFLFSSKAKMRFNHGVVKKKMLKWEVGDWDCHPSSGRHFFCDLLGHIAPSILGLSWIISEVENSVKSILK